MKKIVSGLLLAITIFAINISALLWWTNKIFSESSNITIEEKEVTESIDDEILSRKTIDLIDHNKQTCEIHNLRLEQEKIGISYGIRFLRYLPKSRKIPDPQDLPNGKEFPYSNKFVYGGDCPTGEPLYALVAFCSKCREVETSVRSRRK
jgi:hypothetical protein